MGFFIRKGINFGPVRVNFSKSGVGVSLGTKGLRLGAGPKGAYVQGGRHGLYYRKGLTNNLLCVGCSRCKVGWGLPLSSSSSRLLRTKPCLR